MVTPTSVLDIDIVKKIIEQLQTLNLKDEPIENIKTYFSQIMNGYQVNAFLLNPGLLLYRGVKYSEKPEKIEHIIYPPKHRAKTNRASFEGEQMFYASTSKKPVFYELNVTPGDKLIIATWRTNNFLLFNNVGYTVANFATLNSSRVPPITDPVNGNECNKYIANFLAETFCQKISEETNYLYKLTASIAKVHLNPVYNNNFAGLFYPTIQLNGDEENFAINKSTIDHSLLDFEKIEFIEVVDKSENRYKYEIIDFADEIIDGVINWKNLNAKWTLYDDSDELFFIQENKQLTAYNQMGDIIYPD